MIEAFGYEQAGEAADYIGDKATGANLEPPKISLTLGTGLKTFAERHTHPDTRLVIPARDIPNFPAPDEQAHGHDGNLIIAPIEDGSNETMAIWAGRLHMYQRLLQRIQDQWTRITDPEVRKAAVGFYIAICRRLDVQDILTTNAVGSSNPAHRVGDIVRVSDQMMDPDMDFGVPEDERWFAEKAAADPAYDYGQQDYFYSEARLYSDEINALAQAVAEEQGWRLMEGVLNWRTGRGYEPPAYTRARTMLGATLFAMSTAPETLKARSVGYDNEPGGKHFASFSAVVNKAQIDHDQKIKLADADTEAANEGCFNPFMYELIRRRTRQRARATCGAAV